ncbi:sulfurtransferase [Pseudoxanthomonas broegbernensis]|uniref:Sulfurtransferase n=1 Tax=Pseudoxanthomonas broegbernensis TaxID=83619 RepID=A0A7V8GMA2_9GAMM|nr:sulfurtransferase [Pseudoxanthomonas broegbernensis]KAF1686355.1 sulfurtransferase [Pseudoxanthomonas broegbernensis]MBB6064049.1 thiosulfate/3-mercaptopyruvate sulfurtransferase [Pseudoxanthomonas broegbernensis]
MSDPAWTTLISVERLHAALDDEALRLLDARAVLADPAAGAAAWAVSHLPGAAHADLDRDLSDPSRLGQGRHPLPDAAAFVRRVGEWGIGPAHPVAVYDAGDGSMAAARAWWLLKLLGHARVAVLDGGLAAWRAAGLAETADPAVPAPLPRYPAVGFEGSRIADAAEVLSRLGQAPGWLLDARGGERFRGEVEPIDPVAGHVPGALNRPFALNLRDGRFRPAAELRAELEPLLHGRAPSETLLMCGSGVTACHLLLAMEHAGLAGARVYAGSWSGWIADPSRPVATGPA